MCFPCVIRLEARPQTRNSARRGMQHTSCRRCRQQGVRRWVATSLLVVQVMWKPLNAFVGS